MNHEFYKRFKALSKLRSILILTVCCQLQHCLQVTYCKHVCGPPCTNSCLRHEKTMGLFHDHILYVPEAQKSTVNEQRPKNVQTKPEISAESVGL